MTNIIIILLGLLTSLSCLAGVDTPVYFKVNLSGAMNANGIMSTQLRAQNLIPQVDPYLNQSQMNTSSTNVVDWVLIQLRSANNIQNVVAQFPALLKNDGMIHNLNLQTLQLNVNVGQYYVLINHRNHLPVATAQPINFDGTPVSIDFTNPSTATYGINAQKLIYGEMAMYAGDAYPDGIVKYTGSNNDKDIILQAIGGTNPNAVITAYHNGDVNLDGKVKYTGSNNDRDIILAAIGGVQPTETFATTLSCTSCQSTQPMPMITINNPAHLSTVNQNQTFSLGAQVNLDGLSPNGCLKFHRWQHGIHDVNPSAPSFLGEDCNHNDNNYSISATLNELGSYNLSYIYARMEVSSGTTLQTHTSHVLFINPYQNPNQAPIASNDSLSFTEGTIQTLNLLGNDSDPDNDSISIISYSSLPSGFSIQNGILTIASSVTYGNYNFQYTITDGQLQASAQVNIVIVQDTTNQIPASGISLSDSPIINMSTTQGENSSSPYNNYGGLRTVQLAAQTTINPVSITVKWANASDRIQSSATIYRKNGYEQGSWTQIGTISGSSTQFVDSNIQLGQKVEYKVALSTNLGTVYGYMSSGIGVEHVAFQGKILVLVEAGLYPSIQNNVDVLLDDLKGDRWLPILATNFSKYSSTDSILNFIQTTANQNTDLKSIYIIGNLAPGYKSADPDGHGSRLMAAHSAFADLDANITGGAGWTNSSGNYGIGVQQGAIIQYTQPRTLSSNSMNQIELQIGRIDFSHLPYFGDEITLTNNYLQKAHEHKTKQFVPIKRAIIKNYFPWSMGSQNGPNWPNTIGAWSSFAALVNSNQVDYQVTGTNLPYIFDLNNINDNTNSYLWAYGGNNGASCYTGSINGVVGDKASVNNTNWGGIFNQLWGSYFGETHCTDSFMRGVLTSGRALTNVYANPKYWYFHHMNMGQPIGHSARMSINNNTNLYYPVGGHWVYQNSTGNSYMSLLGDPTLRQEMLAPPSNVQLSGSTLSWNSSADAQAYHIYEITNNTISRITSNPITNTNYVINNIDPNTQYMVTTVKLIHTNSGSLIDESVGVLAD